MPRKTGPEPSVGEMYRAGRPSPGTRLLSAAALLEKGVPAADIGCDHGKLAVYLVMCGLCPRVVAVDARPLPLARAAALAKQCGVENRVDCRLGNGLAPLHPGEVEQVIIAGLSGETIVEILRQAEWRRDQKMRFVLQPTSRTPLLRRWLCERGLTLTREAPVLDMGRVYTNLCAVMGGEPHTPTALFCEVGLLPQAGGEAAAQLLKNRLIDLRNQRKAPRGADETAALQALIQEVEMCLESMK